MNLTQRMINWSILWQTFRDAIRERNGISTGFFYRHVLIVVGTALIATKTESTKF